MYFYCVHEEKRGRTVSLTWIALNLNHFNFTSFKMMNEQLFWINLHWLNKSECHLSFECTCIILEENIRNDLSWRVDRLLMKSSTTHWEKTHNSICCAWLGKLIYLTMVSCYGCFSLVDPQTSKLQQKGKETVT